MGSIGRMEMGKNIAKVGDIDYRKCSSHGDI